MFKKGTSEIIPWPQIHIFADIDICVYTHTYIYIYVCEGVTAQVVPVVHALAASSPRVHSLPSSLAIAGASIGNWTFQG